MCLQVCRLNGMFTFYRSLSKQENIVKSKETSCKDGGIFMLASLSSYKDQPGIGLKLNQAEKYSLFSPFPLLLLLGAHRLGQFYTS